MTLSIIVPDVVFPKRTQLYDIPALSKNAVFAVFGASQAKSLINLNASKPNGTVVGSVVFTQDGAKVLSNTNLIQFKGFGALGIKGVTMMVALKTGPVAGDAGVLNLWSESTKNADTSKRRILMSSTGPNYTSDPAPTNAASARTIVANTEYLLSMTRAAGAPSQVRLHNPDGSVALSSPLADYVGSALPFAADVALEFGNSSNAAQLGVILKGGALWSGEMSEAEISAGAALLYQATRL